MRPESLPTTIKSATSTQTTKHTTRTHSKHSIGCLFRT